MREKSAAYILALLFFLSLVFAFSWPGAWLPKAGWLDEWYYIGYGKYYFSNPDFHSTYYKISRLPWILIQSAYRAALPDGLANLALVYTYVAVMAMLVFYVAKDLVGAKSAFLLALFFSLLPPNQGAGGWNYHNTAAGPFFLVSLVSFGAALKGGRWTALFTCISGAALTLALHSNIVFINILPAFGAVCVAIWLRKVAASGSGPKLPGLLFASKRLGLFILAGVGVTLLLSCINVASGRDWSFWTYQFELAARFVRDNTNQEAWWKPLSSEWILSSPYLIFPFAVFLANLLWCGAALLQSQAGMQLKMLEVDGAKCLLSLQCIYTTLLWIFWQVAGQTALDWSYFSYPLWLSSLFGMMVFFPSATSSGSDEALDKWTVGAGVLMIAPIVLADWTHKISLPSASFVWIASLLLFSAALITSSLLKKNTQCLLVAACSPFVLLTFASGKLPEYSSVPLQSQVNRDLSDAVLRMAEYVGEATMSKGQNTAVWYDENEALLLKDKPTEPVSEVLQRSLSDPAASFNSLGLSGVPRLPHVQIRDIPQRDPHTKYLASTGERFVLVTSNKENISSFIKMLSDLGYPYRVESETLIPTTFFKIPITIVAPQK
jgi:hypothetical protein